MLQNYISYAIQGVPPSQLGFVCKPDMPPHINILFRARPAMPFIGLPEKDHTWKYEGIFSENNDLLDLFEKNPPPEKDYSESKHIRRIKEIAEKIEQQKAVNKEKIQQWTPRDDVNATTDPYKTLFIYKLDKKTDEKKLKKEFEVYGPLKKVRIVRDLNGNSRGYGFVEYEHKSDFKNAYKRAERKKIDENKVMVDYERGRTEKNWKPRRLGGGRGDSRALPYWMENEIIKVKKLYPEISKKETDDENEKEREGSKEGENFMKEKRERSRERSNEQVDKKKRMRSKSKSKEKKEKAGARSAKFSAIEGKTLISRRNFTDGPPVPEDEEDKKTIKAEDNASSEEERSKRHKMEKKEKKQKGEKQTGKREKEKGNSEVEIGEIVA